MPKGIPNKKYTGEFKQRVIEYMLENQLSYNETERKFEIKGQDRVRVWERIYLEEGPEGLYIERRGRKKGSKKNPILDSKVEEDLIAEVQRLRVENAYLKNLQALVLEDERRQHRKRR